MPQVAMPKSSQSKSIPISSGVQAEQDSEKQQLEKTKLTYEIKKLDIENKNAERNIVNLIYSNISIILTIFLGFIGLLKYLKERHDELVKREDERFEEVAKGLGSEQDQQRVSSAVLLPTFLRKGYERFYLQVFNLAAGNLRPHVEGLSKDTPFSPLPLTQALTSVFRESFPRARDTLRAQAKDEKDQSTGRYLNAGGVQLDRAFLAGADLRDAWLRESSLRGAILRGANLQGANLERSDLSDTHLDEATMREANLQEVNFTGAVLDNAELSGARADKAKFFHSSLVDINMTGGTIGSADFSGADLSGAKFQGVKFAPGSPGDKAANPEAAANIKNAVFEDVTGLTKAQIELCKEKGAIFRASPSPRSP
jgi:hypothetical protein